MAHKITKIIKNTEKYQNKNRETLKMLSDKQKKEKIKYNSEKIKLQKNQMHIKH